MPKLDRPLEGGGGNITKIRAIPEIANYKKTCIHPKHMITKIILVAAAPTRGEVQLCCIVLC